MLNNEYKTKVMKELENISEKELINLLKEAGSAKIDDGQKEKSDFEGDAGMLTKKELWGYAKKIRDCCQAYRYNAETNYCHGCPFWYKGDYFTGCILQDSRRNEVDNPGDWDLD